MKPEGIKREIIGNVFEVGGERRPRVVIDEPMLGHRTILYCTEAEAREAGAYLFQRVIAVGRFVQEGGIWVGHFVAIQPAPLGL